MSLEQIFLASLVANLVGFGGLSSLPILRGQLLKAGLPADTLLLHSLAVGKISPGPNGLYLVATGYFIAGSAGALVATLSLLAPPFLVLVLERVRSRLFHLRRFRAAMHSLSLVVVALLAVSSASLVRHAVTNTIDVLMVVSGAVLLLRGLPSIVGIVIAIVTGFLIP